MSDQERKITGRNPGERVLAELVVDRVLLRQLPVDPEGLRISIGQTLLMSNPDAYLVYRGDRNEIIRLLRRALEALEDAPWHAP